MHAHRGLISTRIRIDIRPCCFQDRAGPPWFSTVRTGRHTKEFHLTRYLVRIGLVVVVALTVIAIFHRYGSLGGDRCTVLGAGVASADEDCLHYDAVSQSWAEAQQQQLKFADATLTTGLLHTDTNGQNATVITSGSGGTEYELVMRYLAPYAGRQILDRPPGAQAAEHVEAKAAAAMRRDGETYGVLVINNPKGPCDYASGPGCDTVMELILPKGSEIVVWWPGGHHDIYSGRA